MTSNNVTTEKISFDFNVIIKNTWNCINLGSYILPRNIVDELTTINLYKYILDNFSDFFKGSSVKKNCEILTEFWGMNIPAIKEEYSGTKVYYYTVTNIHILKD